LEHIGDHVEDLAHAVAQTHPSGVYQEAAE
jgi:hypothetical protein